MKKILFLLPVLILVAACSSPFKSKSVVTPIQIPVSSEPAICAVSTTTSTTISTTTRDLLPPVSSEEKSKTFTYEDEELGVKLKYPGSCYFNKGIFQCSNFTMSIWVLDGEQKASANPEISVKEGKTELKYSFVKGDKTYQLLAWYDGQDNAEIDATIDKIVKTFAFTR